MVFIIMIYSTSNYLPLKWIFNLRKKKKSGEYGGVCPYTLLKTADQKVLKIGSNSSSKV